MSNLLRFCVTIDPSNGSFSVSNLDTDETQTLQYKQAVKKAAKSDTDALDSDDPELFILENSYYLNKKARELMKVTEGDRLNIVYSDKGVPMLVIDSHGNKLTRAFKVALKGVALEELSKRGDRFLLVQRTETIFELSGSIKPESIVIEDENLQLPDEMGVLEDPDVFTLDELLEIDESNYEIKAMDLQL